MNITMIKHLKEVIFIKSKKPLCIFMCLYVLIYLCVPIDNGDGLILMVCQPI